MQNLGFSLNLTPDKATLACPSLGYDRRKIQFSNSRHLVVDLTCLVKALKQKGTDARSFAAQETQRTHPKDFVASRVEAALEGDEEDEEVPHPPEPHQDAGAGRPKVGRRVRIRGKQPATEVIPEDETEEPVVHVEPPTHEGKVSTALETCS
eukprot:2921167-Prorocentrum_lima.AAC.2